MRIVKRTGPHSWRVLRDDERDKLVRERNQYREALEEIRNLGGVCEQFEVCTHRSCRDSYGAWAVADAVLNEVRTGSGT